MRKVLSIVYYEYRLQSRRPAAWAVLFAALLISLADNFPSAGNLARLEFLSQPEYFIYRTIGMDGAIMAFGLVFLLSDRISVDEKAGVKPLMMAAPLRKWQYIAGKMIGAFCFSYTMLCAFLLAGVLVYSMPFPGACQLLRRLSASVRRRSYPSCQSVYLWPFLPWLFRSLWI